jgi:hypothetical protein
MLQILKRFELLPQKLQQRFIANAVDAALRKFFPKKYYGLCYLYAIVGSNLLSILLHKHYIPVGGIAILDAGGGMLLELLDVAGFQNDKGGEFHCWIESDQDDRTELIDFTFRHNASYAKTHGLQWKRKKESFLWGYKDDLVLPVARDELPERFPEGKVWYQPCEEGTIFLTRHIWEHTKEHIKITHYALKLLAVEVESHVNNREPVKLLTAKAIEPARKT